MLHKTKFDPGKYTTYSRRQKNREIRSLARFRWRSRCRCTGVLVSRRGFIREARAIFEQIENDRRH